MLTSTLNSISGQPAPSRINWLASAGRMEMGIHRYVHAYGMLACIHAGSILNYYIHFRTCTIRTYEYAHTYVHVIVSAKYYVEGMAKKTSVRAHDKSIPYEVESLDAHAHNNNFSFALKDDSQLRSQVDAVSE